MSEDYAIESADAGASETIPMEAGQIKKGGYVSSRIFCVHFGPMELPMSRAFWGQVKRW